MECSQEEWPEPIVRVQTLSAANVIPDRYIKPPAERPSLQDDAAVARAPLSVPVIDLGNLVRRRRSRPRDQLDDRLGAGADEEELITESSRTDADADDDAAAEVARAVATACREWGFIQVVNHGVQPELLDRFREVWREFFHLPMEAKQAYANNPRTFEGYGSRLGVEKGAPLDWGDYYFLVYFPEAKRNRARWPALPPSLRETVDAYATAATELAETMLTALSLGAGLDGGFFRRTFGGEGQQDASLRVNYYPKCPQPELALGLSAHSDPGGITVLLPDDHVKGLQVRKDESWVTIDPIPYSFIVNIGDQIQLMSNGIYKSVEHRVIVNATKERYSAALFYNPKGDVLLEPVKEFVTPDRPPLYKSITSMEYRMFVRKMGPRGKSDLKSLEIKS